MKREKGLCIIMSLNEYKLDTGFLSTEANSNQVIYLESDKTHIEQFALDHYVKKNLMEIKLLFSGYGLEFIHLSTWLDEQSNDDLMQYMRYYTPWIKSAYPYSLRRAYKRKIKELQRIWAPDTGNSAVIKGDGGAFEVYSVSPELYYDLFVQIAKTWGHKIEHDNNIRFREARPDIRFSLSPDDIHETCAEESQVLYQTITNPLDDEYAEADRMYLELKKKHPGWALKAILSAQLSKEEVISPIVINNPRNLILPEYNMEIHMAPATMAFYLLYLKHPEGIRFKDLIGYRNELCRF